jgi:hypothetical protein
MTNSAMMYAGDQPIGFVTDYQYYGNQQSTWDSAFQWIDNSTLDHTFAPYRYFDTPTFLGGQIVYETDDWEIFKMVAVLKDVIDMFVVVNKNDNAIVFTSLDYDEAEAHIHAQRIKEIL